MKRGADVASDHHLLLAKLKLKLKKNWMKEHKKRHKYNVSVLKDPKTKEDFNLSLINRFQVLQEVLEQEEEEVDVETHWQHVQDTVMATCEEVVGPQKYHQKKWISIDTLRKVQERK